MRRLLACTILVLLLVAGAGACGDDTSDGDGAEAGGASSANGSGGEAWPVTIEHAFGSTTIDRRPERIVALDVQWTDVLLAMDVTPVGHLVDRSAGQEGNYPWQEGRLDGSTEITMTDAVPFEQINELDPDLILVTYVADEQDVFDTLSSIAPTVGLLSSRQVDPWQDQAEVVGQVLGEPDRAQDVISEVESIMEETSDQLPGLNGKTASLVNYLPGDSLWVVADPEDGSSVFFEQLGMELNPDIVALADEGEGRIRLSFERVDMLDSDLLILLTNDGDPYDLPGYDTLPAVTSGGVEELSFDEVVGLNTPTPLSVPFVLDLIRPTLETVATS